ncbi:MAG TPA: peptidoglycan DD-metalloendopeptidase family protein [Polyangia bacterium]|nr:peptidoglycan DD-metalloendopeptidase family protein [Polyangia bacterium]
MARSLVPKRRKRRSSHVRSSLGLGTLLVALTGVNVYFFFFRADTAVRKLMQPVSTERTLADNRKDLAQESIPPSLLGASWKGKKSAGGEAQTTAAGTDRSGSAASRVVGGDSDGHAVEGEFGPSDTLSTVLARESFGSAAGAVTRALTKVVDPKLIRPSEHYAVVRDDEGTVTSFEYAPTLVLRYVVAQKPDGTWQARKEEKALVVKATDVSGTIDSSLYESVSKAGESGALVSLLVDLFAWDINFYIDTHPGDHWKVVVEKQYLGGQFYKYGSLLAAEYGGKAGTFRGFYWNPSGQRGRGHYYDEKGQALAKSMLKTPLRFVRISSKFDRHRFHPILHRMKAHLGIDYAAPVGTPVWATAGGKLAEVGMKPGSGNTVVINHGSGLQTRYYHLSRFAKGLKPGKPVQQKEVIGYVGTTGLSTGPHLHFSVVKAGVFIDPSKLTVSREPAVANRSAYLDAIRPRLAALRNLPPAVAKN